MVPESVRVERRAQEEPKPFDIRLNWKALTVDAKLADYDWDALSSAATSLPAPSRLTVQLDRDECLARHAHLERRERDLDNAKQVRTARAIIGPGKRSSAAALLHQLDPLDDGFLSSASSVSLNLNQPARGKLLPVRIISQPLRTVSVQFVVEDARGNPVPVQLFHVPTTSIPQDQLHDWFPIGAIFGIKEPLFRSLNDGSSYYIRIESPVDIIRLYPRSPLLTNVRFPSPRLGPGGTRTSHWLDPVAESPARFKEAGDKAFATGRLVRAQEAYQLALDALQGDPSSTPTPSTSTSPSKSDDDQLLLRVKVHANLAQTLLRLELPECAHRAAQAGLLVLESSSSSHSTPTAPTSSSLRIKLLYRRALGLYRVGQYDPALKTCEEAIRRSIAAATDHPDKNPNSSSSKGEATALLERIKQRQLEAERGPSAETLRSLWLSSVVEQRRAFPQSSPAAAAEVDLPADWIDSASISISPHIPGKQGHGLVALRPIKRGQLLMCCKPLASAGGGGPREGQRRYRYTVGVNLWTRSEDPWAVREVVSQVLWRAALEDQGQGEGEGDGGSGSLGRRGRTREAIAPLWAGTQLGRCRDPDRDRRPEDDVDVVSPSKVEGAVTFNGFHVEDVTASSSSSAAASRQSSLSTADGRDNDVDPDPDKDQLFHAPTALYPEYPSALNHSCLSNCTYTFLSSVFLLRARVDIAPGEELVDSYVDAADQLEVRAAKLAAHGFECACPLCVEERQAGAKVRRRRIELVRRAEEELAEPRRMGLDELGRIVSELEQTYPATTHIRPALYPPLRLLSEALAAAAATPGGGPPSPDPIANELRALQSLGARFSTTTGSSEGLEELLEPPRVRDMDGVMSALWIAKEWRRRGEPGKCRHWISLARSIEAGQAGEELFDLRYGNWARKHGLDLKL